MKYILGIHTYSIFLRIQKKIIETRCDETIVKQKKVENKVQPTENCNFMKQSLLQITRFFFNPESDIVIYQLLVSDSFQHF